MLKEIIGHATLYTGCPNKHGNWEKTWTSYLISWQIKRKSRLHLWRAFHTVVYFSWILKLTKILEIMKILIFAITLSILKKQKIEDHILKISRPGVFDIRCLNWNTEQIVFINKYPMDRRQYKSRHIIPMFIVKPCRIKFEK